MIRSIRHAGLRRFLLHDDSRRLPPQYRERIRNILGLLAEANRPGDLASPGFRLRPLKGRGAWWSVRVSSNWRIVFRFEEGHAWDVDFVDYH